MIPRTTSIATALIAFSCLTRPTHAQDTVTVVTPTRGTTLDLRSRAARDAVSRFNAANTTRFFGSTRIAGDETIRGDLGVHGGTLDMAGTVGGDVVVINGDVRFRSNAVVRGDLIVLGGTVAYPDGEVRVDGSVAVYRARVLVRERADELELLRGEARTSEPPRWRRRYRRTDASIVISTGRTYNRVEGLPIHLGPRFEWSYGRSASVRLEALGILRTAGDFESDRQDLGYTAGFEIRMGTNERVTIAGRVYDVVVPIEAWQLSDEEVGLAAFLWHRDYRDYYMQRGVAGRLGLHPSHDITLELTVARNEETSAVARDPWTPFRGDDFWRPNPAIDEGHFISVHTRALYDTRPSHSSYRSGWRLSAEWEHGMSDDLIPRPVPAMIRDPLGTDLTFDRVFIDLRRYEGLSRHGQIAVRAVATAVVGDGKLPIQRRLSLGGPDPLPGFPFRRITCGGLTVDPANPALCDRMLLFQFEYRGGLFLGADWDLWNDRDVQERHRRARDREWDDWAWFDGPEFVLFSNAGTAWLDGDDIGEFEADVGAGLEFGSVGVYAAKSVTENHDLQFALRIHRRF
jgi:hypothetical protein